MIPALLPLIQILKKDINLFLNPLLMVFIVNSDGAAALVLTSGEMARKLGLQVIAKIRGFADAAQVLRILVLIHWFPVTYKLVL